LFLQQGQLFGVVFVYFVVLLPTVLKPTASVTAIQQTLRMRCLTAKRYSEGLLTEHVLASLTNETQQR